MTTTTERKVYFLYFILICLFTGLDIFEDILEGATLSHLLIEGSMILIAILGAITLWRRSFRSLKSKNRLLSREVISARKDAAHWKEDTATLLAGLGAKIELQFDQWHLSDAEKDVALLLLKGFSHKEIANLRGTSEKTIRHQSAAVYRKTDLEGRSQLSAYFLEDLLFPGVAKKSH